jgi:ceroid-lipofuscinosis MFS transporter 7
MKSGELARCIYLEKVQCACFCIHQSYRILTASNLNSFFVLNQYSAVAYFMASLCIVTLFLLLTRFHARHREEPTAKTKKSQRRMEQDELANRVTWFGLSVYNAALLGLMLLNITTKGSIGAFETMGINFAQSYFDLQPVVAGTILSLSGIVGVLLLLSIGFLGRFLTDTQMIIGGITVFAIGTVSFASLQSVEMGAENSIVHYIVAIFMIYGLGYPIAHTALIGLFSKGKFGNF